MTDSRLAKQIPHPRWGNFRRTRPFSEMFGGDRGTPLDRHYVHRFLDANRDKIRGRVLEIQSPAYTRLYGADLVEAHGVDINPDHAPTYVCDLALSEGVLPEAHYDCFLLPNTLCALRDLEPCLRAAMRTVRPGGWVLASTAAFVPLMPDAPDYWHMGADGWREIARRVWPDAEPRVESHGNCLAAAAAMMGLSCDELTPAELDFHDPRYPVLVTVACRRPGA